MGEVRLYNLIAKQRLSLGFICGLFVSYGIDEIVHGRPFHGGMFLLPWFGLYVLAYFGWTDERAIKGYASHV